MKKLQSILSIVTIAILSSFILLLYSCEDDDICTDEGQVPRLVADIYYTGSDTKLEDSIYYWVYTIKDSTLTGTNKDTIALTSGNGSSLNKSTFGMIVTKNTHKKIIYTIAQGRDRPGKDENNADITILAPRDRLVLEYKNTGNIYTSKACGFGLTFTGVKVSLVTKKTNGEGNWIKKIKTINTEIKDGSTPIIKLFTNPRN